MPIPLTNANAAKLRALAKQRGYPSLKQMCLYIPRPDGRPRGYPYVRVHKVLIGREKSRWIVEGVVQLLGEEARECFAEGGPR